MHPHIPRPRRKATRTCTDTAGVVRTVHGVSMWLFTARVNEKTAPIERIAAVAICRRLKDARGRIYAPPSTANALLRALPPMTAQTATALGPALDEPGALQQSSTVHVSEGSTSTDSACPRDFRFTPNIDRAADMPDWQRSAISCQVAEATICDLVPSALFCSSQ